MNSNGNLANGSAKKNQETPRNLEMLLANGRKLRLRCDADFVVNATRKHSKAISTMREQLQKLHQASENHHTALTYSMFDDTGSDDDVTNLTNIDNEHAR